MVRIPTSGRYTRAMRLPALATLLLAALVGAACATGDGASGDVAGDPSGSPLTVDVFPFSAPPGTFATPQGGLVGIRLEPQGADATRMWITGDFPQRRIDWRKQDGAIVLSDGPDRAIELLRIGARPGASWSSSGQRISFAGWERVETPAGTWDAVRVSAVSGIEGLRVVETWWFAREVGLVRYAQDKGGLFTLEMYRVR